MPRATRARDPEEPLWGYGHDAVFAGLTALGAGIEVATEAIAHHIAERHGTVLPIEAVVALLAAAAPALIVVKSMLRRRLGGQAPMAGKRRWRAW